MACPSRRRHLPRHPTSDQVCTTHGTLTMPLLQYSMSLSCSFFTLRPERRLCDLNSGLEPFAASLPPSCCSLSSTSSSLLLRTMRFRFAGLRLPAAFRLVAAGADALRCPCAAGLPLPPLPRPPALTLPEKQQHCVHELQTDQRNKNCKAVVHVCKGCTCCCVATKPGIQRFVCVNAHAVVWSV
jgi:hypothetical protein